MYGAPTIVLTIVPDTLAVRPLVPWVLRYMQWGTPVQSCPVHFFLAGGFHCPPSGAHQVSCPRSNQIQFIFTRQQSPSFPFPTKPAKLRLLGLRFYRWQPLSRNHNDISYSCVSSRRPESQASRRRIQSRTQGPQGKTRFGAVVA